MKGINRMIIYHNFSCLLQERLCLFPRGERSGHARREEGGIPKGGVRSHKLNNLAQLSVSQKINFNTGIGAH